MKKNKRVCRIFSRVLDRLAWANFYHVCEENDKAYKELLAAKRVIEEFGGEDVKVVFYEREYHIMFTLQQHRDYTVSASHGYENDYHDTNKSHVNALIASAEFVRYCTLRRNYSDYQKFNEIAESVLYEVLTLSEFAAYCRNGEVSAIPYDVAIRLWRELHSCTEKIANEAVAQRKAVL